MKLQGSSNRKYHVVIMNNEAKQCIHLYSSIVNTEIQSMQQDNIHDLSLLKAHLFLLPTVVKNVTLGSLVSWFQNRI
jgi:hypothetical protein